MRKVCLAALVAFFVANPASAQNNWANKLFEKGNPKDAIVVDFGVVARGAQLEKNLKMTNIWKVPLTIDTRVSCGCVTATPSKKILQPEESAVLTIKMDGTLLQGGPKLVNVYVHVGGEFASTAYIEVKANARKDVALNPGEIDFGAQQRGSSVDRSLEVGCAGKPAWKVTGVVPVKPNPPFDLRLENLPAHIENGNQIIGFRVHATLRGDAPVGNFRELVDLITNDREQQKVTFIVTGSVLPSITAQPNPVQPLGLKVGVPFKTPVTISAAQPFKIVGITKANADDVNLTMPAGAEKFHVLELQITPKVAGPILRELILHTDLRNETVKVVLKSNVNP